MVSIQEDLGRRLRSRTAKRRGRQMPGVAVRGQARSGIDSIHPGDSIDKNIEANSRIPRSKRGEKEKRVTVKAAGTRDHSGTGVTQTPWYLPREGG